MVSKTHRRISVSKKSLGDLVFKVHTSEYVMLLLQYMKFIKVLVWPL